jgi:hypothetical protein
MVKIMGYRLWVMGYELWNLLGKRNTITAVSTQKM